ncbi:MAG: hypothetical protein HC892_00215 [Saprospiraceae bacterium]|nr:hypothetical protein [Saprospiraceae bacterium]
MLAEMIGDVIAGTVDASTVTLTVANEAEWNGNVPSSVKEAIDFLVARLTVVEGAAIPSAENVQYGDNGAFSPHEPTVQDALDNIGGRLTSLEASPFGTSQTSLIHSLIEASDSDDYLDRFDDDMSGWTEVGVTTTEAFHAKHYTNAIPEITIADAAGATFVEGFAEAIGIRALQRPLAFSPLDLDPDSSFSYLETKISIPSQFPYTTDPAAGIWIGGNQSASGNVFFAFGLRIIRSTGISQLFGEHYTNWTTKSVSPLINVAMSGGLVSSVYIRLHVSKYLSGEVPQLGIFPHFSLDGINWREFAGAASISYAPDDITHWGLVSMVAGSPPNYTISRAVWEYAREYHQTLYRGTVYNGVPNVHPSILKVSE